MEKTGGKEAVDVLHLFREMLVDIICEASFNFKVGALKARTREGHQHYLVRAIDDFPKVGVLVGTPILRLQSYS